jgi:hypothetical protein
MLRDIHSWVSDTYQTEVSLGDMVDDIIEDLEVV